MSFGKKKRKWVKFLVLILTVVVLLLAVTAGLYVLYSSKVEEISSNYETEIQLLRYDATALKRIVWLSHEEIKAGTILQKEQLYSSEMSSSLLQGLFMTEEDFDKVLLVDVEPEVPIMQSMLFEEVIGKDTREEELNMIFLPSNLELNCYVDVRIGFPNGEDYIVLTKMKVRGRDLNNNTLWLWMDEKEILTLSSAIVDAYLHKGTKLYTVTYVAPTIQEEALPNYPVNVDVLKVIQGNPNIMEEARQGLSDDVRKLLDIRLSLLSEEALSSVDQGIKQEVSDRSLVIDEHRENEKSEVQESILTEPIPPETSQKETETVIKEEVDPSGLY